MRSVQRKYDGHTPEVVKEPFFLIFSQCYRNYCKASQSGWEEQIQSLGDKTSRIQTRWSEKFPLLSCEYIRATILGWSAPYGALISKLPLFMNCFIDSLFLQPNCTLPRRCLCWAHLTKCMRAQRQPRSAGRLHDGRTLLSSQSCSFPSSQARTSACIALYHSVISQALILSSCKPISWLTPLSMSLRALSRDSLCKKPFTRARVCAPRE